ncbi:MFS transporter [Clostridium akagii]|uniref:MFS transporter n=1 Tax=Clostridium akagii TaxID=91623 RepID=UPI00047939C6|nr:MFS transporter [Clostridium akagii]
MSNSSSNSNVILSLKEKLSYGASDAGYNLVFTVISSFLMFYYTDVAGVNIVAVGTLFLVVRVLDGVVSPIVGALIDKTNTRWGKIRPWFLWFTWPFAIIGVMTFSVPSIGANGQIVYMYVTYILMNIMASAVGVPITALLPSLTTNPQERIKANTFRCVCGQVSVLVASMATLPLVSILGHGNQKTGFFLTLLLYGVVAVCLQLTAFKNTKERVIVEKQKEAPLFISIKALVHNVPWWILAILNFVIFTGIVVKLQATVYFFKYNIGNENIASIANGLNAFAMILAMALVPIIAKKLKNKNIVILGLLISIAGQLILYIATTNHSIVITLMGAAIASFGLGGAQSIVFVMFADTVDYGEWKFKVRAQGLVTSAGTIGVQCGAGIAGVLMSFILSKAGFIPNVVEKSSALNAISFCYVWLPVITLIICIVLICFYRLDSCREEMLSELARRHNESV